MSRVAILGGTFNPIHNGHLYLAKECAQILDFGQVLLMPTAIPPHKQPKELLSNEDRLALCRLAAQEDPLFQVSDLEMKLPPPSYTYRTLRELHAQKPDDSFFWIMGGDMLLSFAKWVRYEEILSLSTIVAAAREPGEYEQMKRYHREVLHDSDRVKLLAVRAYPVSSTEIRNRIHQGLPWTHLVPQGVADYLQEHRCYLSNREEE